MGSFNGDQSSSDGFASRMLQAGLLLDKYYTPLLCLFGTLGNSLSLTVFRFDSQHNRQSSSYYLSALAVSDTGFLLNLFAVWLESVTGGVITSDLMCPLVMYLGQVTCFISIYLTVAFSIERYVAVHHPFSRPRICTKSKAKKIIFAVTTIALIIFSYAWIIAKVIEIPKQLSFGNGKSQPQIELPNDNSTNMKLNETNIGNDTALKSSIPPFLLLKKSIQAEGDLMKVTTIEYPPRQSEKSQNVDLLEAKNDNVEDQTKQSGDSFRFRDHFNELPDPYNENNTGFYPCATCETVRDGLDLNQYRPPTSSSSSSSLAKNPGAEQKQGFLDGLLRFISAKKSTNSSYYMCSVPLYFHKVSEIANYLDTAITLILPFILITYFNVRISISVWKLKDERGQIVAPSSLPKRTESVVVEMEESGAIRSRKKPQSTLKNKRLSIHRDHFPYAKHDNNSRIRTNEKFRSTLVHSSATSTCTTLCKNKSTIEQSQAGMQSFPALHNTTSSRHNSVGKNMKSRLFIFRRGKRGCYHHHHRPKSSEVKVTKTLLLVSTVFLFLNLPLHVIRCTQFIQSATGTQEGNEILQALQPWANLLFNTSFAVNFLLYCACGNKFRKSLLSLATRLLRKTTMPPLSSARQNRNNSSRRNERGICEKKWKREKVDSFLSSSSSSPTQEGITDGKRNLASSSTRSKRSLETQIMELGEMVCNNDREHATSLLSDTDEMAV